MPSVSVIMANYNGAAFMGAALETALAQTLPPLEVIVADDASRDASAEVVRRVAMRDPRVRLLEASANAGPAAARNRAIAQARGEWLAVMDSDDLMHPERLARLLAAAARDGADVVADDMLAFDSEGRQAPWPMLTGDWALGPRHVGAAEYARANALYGKGPALGYLKPVFRRALLADGLRYREDMPVAEDYELVQRMLLAGARYLVVPELLYFYRRHSSSTSHRLAPRAIEAMRSADAELRALPGAGGAEIARALDERLRSIERAAAFDAIIAALKSRRFGEAARQAIAAPRAAALLRLPLWKRLGRPPSPRAETRGPVVCLLATGRAEAQRRAVEAEGCAAHVLKVPATATREAALAVAREAPSTTIGVLAEPGVAWAVPYAPRPGLASLVTADESVARSFIASSLRGSAPQAPRQGRTHASDEPPALALV
jgi:succinoglycan biosynthesis protein ExoO